MKVQLIIQIELIPEQIKISKALKHTNNNFSFFFIFHFQLSQTVRHIDVDTNRQILILMETIVCF